MKVNRSFSSMFLRISAICFAAGSLTAFVWYAQTRAQRPAKSDVPEVEKAPTVISGSKSYSGPVFATKKVLMSGSKSGTLIPAPGQVPDSIDGLIQGTQESEGVPQKAITVKSEGGAGLLPPTMTNSSHSVAPLDLPNLPPPAPAPKMVMPEPKASGVPGAPNSAPPRSGVIMWGSKAPAASPAR